MGCFESLYRVAYGLICLASSTIESIRIQAREDVNCALVNDSKEWKQIEHFLYRFSIIQNAHDSKTYRNLASYYHHKQNDVSKAEYLYQTAILLGGRLKLNDEITSLVRKVQLS